mmetsp:Transcript_83019/g.160413  ORF Transcript_83019/g.160413 Transcript_83019/m.160413 type:complete len:200 (-) Transcript_83019:293-892(-)
MMEAIPCPSQEAHLGAGQPPHRVGLSKSFLSINLRLVVCNDVAAILGEEVSSELPPLCKFGLCEGVASFCQLRNRRICIHRRHLFLPICNSLCSFSLNLVRFLLHFSIDQAEVEVRVLIHQVESPPCDLRAELGLAAFMAVPGLRCSRRGSPVEGQVCRAMWGVVAKPHDAKAMRLCLNHMRKSGAVHGDSALPLANSC